MTDLFAQLLPEAVEAASAVAESSGRALAEWFQVAAVLVTGGTMLWKMATWHNGDMEARKTIAADLRRHSEEDCRRFGDLLDVIKRQNEIAEKQWLRNEESQDKIWKRLDSHQIAISEAQGDIKVLRERK